MATPLLTATHTLCIMEGDLHVENLEELIRIAQNHQNRRLKRQLCCLLWKTRSITIFTGLIPGEQNEYVEALQEKQFYQDHWYLHPDFDETKYSCKGEMRKEKRLVLYTVSVGINNKASQPIILPLTSYDR